MRDKQIKKPAQILNDFCPVKGASVHFEIVYVTPCFFLTVFPIQVICLFEHQKIPSKWVY